MQTESIKTHAYKPHPRDSMTCARVVVEHPDFSVCVGTPVMDSLDSMTRAKKTKLEAVRGEPLDILQKVFHEMNRSMHRMPQHQREEMWKHIAQSLGLISPPPLSRILEFFESSPSTRTNEYQGAFRVSTRT